MRFCLSVLTAMVVGASTVTAQAFGPRDVDALPSRAPQLVARYGADSLQFGELRLPTGAGPFPVAVVIHGGCWTVGFATLKNTAPIASALVEQGIATWNIEYRQLGNPGAGWPGTFLDVGAGIDHLRTQGSPQEMLPLGVPQYLVAAQVLRVDDATRYQLRGRAVGDSVAIHLVTNGNHFDVIAPGRVAWPAVEAFLRQAFGLPPQ